MDELFKNLKDKISSLKIKKATLNERLASLNKEEDRLTEEMGKDVSDINELEKEKLAIENKLKKFNEVVDSLILELKSENI